MADYISRDAALDAILSEYPDAHYPSFFADKIKKIPAADVIEVVRCEACEREARSLMARLERLERHFGTASTR